MLTASVIISTGSLGTATWAWNPYDTDSSRSDDSVTWRSSPGSYRAPNVPRQPGRAPTGDSGSGYDRWDQPSQWYMPGNGFGDRRDQRWSDQQTGGDDYGWGDGYATSGPRSGSQRWRDAEGGVPAAPAQPGSWGEFRSRSLYDDFRQPRREPPIGYPDGRDQPDWRDERSRPWGSMSRQADVEAGVQYRGYEFRHDPDLSAPGGHRQNGWEFRPLTGREQERIGSDGLYPRIDEGDYRQRGPWRSYEDEGTAFGYHSRGTGFGGGPYPEFE